MNWYKTYKLSEMKIYPYNEESYDSPLEEAGIDQYDAANSVEEAFRASEIRPDRDKQLTHVVTINGKVVGGIYSKLEQDHSMERDDIWRYSFDVAIHPDYRAAEAKGLMDRTIFKLIDTGLAEWRAYKAEHGKVYCWIWAVNPKIANILERVYGFERENISGQSILTKW